MSMFLLLLKLSKKELPALIVWGSDVPEKKEQTHCTLREVRRSLFLHIHTKSTLLGSGEPLTSVTVTS